MIAARHSIAAAVAALGAAAGVSAAPSVVHGWDGSSTEREVTGAGVAGLSIEITGRADVIPWSRVRSVRGPAAGEAEAYLGLAEDAWRATSRLARGDAYGAEPIFERLFERTRGEAGPTPAIVAEGLLRCRLRRDARASAVGAWLDLHANLDASPTGTPLWGIRSPAIDDESLLCPALPPIWFPGPAASAFAGRSEGDLAMGGATDAMGVLYAAAARAVSGGPIDAGATSRAVELASERSAGRLVADLVLAQIGGADARREARASLERERQPGVPPWRRVWATIAIGRSLVAEPGSAVRRRGVLELISVHALDRDATPYLAGVALADAALACDAVGDRDAARSLLSELMASAPSHPVWDSPPIVELSESLPGRVPAR